ncbi:hypothetical protein HJ526_17180 [Donghicola sp. C2-DW-16]|uniref:Calcium-binding protein n=1 Tax=Donghicola mangrovi TaxID=2729614 RepID=A0ABX2PI33_9RHOB|nr:calcium-binding protein [Donghicola mangrovi]NVO29160.1 hypothetical protein [Donghicola mangrovi]
MAVINGTQTGENLAGTNDADVITGFAGDDVINGVLGNDTIDGGAGKDNILGGDGDDTIVIASQSDLTVATTGTLATDLADGANDDTIDGGAGNDTLISGLAAGDDLNNGTAVETLWGATGVQLSNVEFVQVSNASDFLLDLSADATFAFDETVTSADGASILATVNAETYTASTGAVAGDAFAVAQSKGITIGGVTYASGDTFQTALGATVTVGFTTAWTLTYDATASTALYAVGDATVATDDLLDQSIVATISDINDNTVDVAIDFAINLDAGFTAAAATSGIISSGDTQANNIIGSAFDDIIWAGAGDTANDTIDGGAGNDILGGAGGADTINGGAGNDTVYGGAGNDTIDGGVGDDMIWTGADTDTVVASAGNDTIGGGAGADNLNGGDGNDIIYGGSDVAVDTINGGAGADTVYGGAGADVLNGDAGDDIIFNGADNDAVNGGAGNDTIWGGAGNDALTGGADKDTFAFVAGNGNDTITDFSILSTTAGDGDVLDLSAFEFANTQAVINAMTQNTGSVTLAIAPGQTITFTGAESDTIAEFQAAVDDWVIV